ncbi:hypothetical protein GCM10010123_05810 [Pilimelia anulata]|uniref:NlpC/P60 domain-containing protein n=1 Tax=Pilimelia anulata TaxID=53371 RepID=A0A8J3B0I4_9ACTN|nr:hypothetical protein [Pilimelia anulata]GGJ78730.1 hypothetical protein GCM10010123_05810 [Pilimelia anulata]
MSHPTPVDRHGPAHPAAAMPDAAPTSNPGRGRHAGRAAAPTVEPRPHPAVAVPPARPAVDERFGTVVVVVAALLLGTASVVGFVRRPVGHRAAGPVPTAPGGDGYTYDRLTDPARTVVRAAGGAVVAVLTDGSRTVRLTGPPRRFTEPRLTPRTVHTDARVRLLPRPWRATAYRTGWFADWFARARDDRSPDVLDVVAQYLDGAPEQRDRAGVRFAGDAAYRAPADDDGDGRAESPDFHDYLGVPWSFPDGATRQPTDGRYGNVDGPGFVRLVYGYRLGLRLRSRADTGTGGLPRTAAGIAARGSGTLVARDRSGPPSLGALQEGDLVLFADGPAGTAITRVGIYLGPDDNGRPRFAASRSRADGPTFGDTGGRAELDGGGHYARSLRAIRRL